MKCTFEEEGFYFEALDPRSNEKYALAMPRTREKIFPDKSKYYVRKNKIYIALHKQVKGNFSTKFHYFLRKKKIGGHLKEYKNNLILELCCVIFSVLDCEDLCILREIFKFKVIQDME